MADVPPPGPVSISLTPPEHIDVRAQFTEAGPVFFIGHKLVPGSGVAVLLHDALKIAGGINNIAHDMLVKMQQAAQEQEMQRAAQAAGLVHRQGGKPT